MSSASGSARQNDLNITFKSLKVHAGLVAGTGDCSRSQKSKVLELVQRKLMNSHWFDEGWIYGGEALRHLEQ